MGFLLLLLSPSSLHKLLKQVEPTYSNEPLAVFAVCGQTRFAWEVAVESGIEELAIWKFVNTEEHIRVIVCHDAERATFFFVVLGVDHTN